MPLPGQEAFEFGDGPGPEPKPFDESHEWKSEPVEVLHIGQPLLDKLIKAHIKTLGQLDACSASYLKIPGMRGQDAEKLEAAVAQYHRFVEMDRREGL